MPPSRPPRPAPALTTPIEALPGVTPARADAFRRLGIPSLAHLLYHLPSRHERLEAESDIAHAEAGALITVRGEVTDTRPVLYGRRPRFEAVLLDETGRVELVWFHQLFLRERIRPGVRLRVQGKAARRGATLRLVNPRWEVLDDRPDEPPARQARLRPIYPASEDLPSWAIEKSIDAVLDEALPLVQDHLTPGFRADRALPELAQAYRMMHRPSSEAEVDEARRRLVYDELLLLQLGVHMKRAYTRSTLHAPPLKWTSAIDQHIRARLRHTLTPGQESVVRDLIADLQQPTPASRLIQGDVGSGKTLVALYAMLMGVASRHQAAMMAPTELLAEQHYASIASLLRGSTVRIALLTGSLPPLERSRVLDDLASGAVDLVIGTHALLTESVMFASLAVAVIDEQHRFGVHQRARLREKSADDRSAPHTLVVTATPIPRTLAMTVFGDLDVSVLHGMPEGRAPVTTSLATPRELAAVYDRVRVRLDRGEQGFAVVPRIGAAANAAPTLGTDPDPEAPEGEAGVQALLKRLEAGPLKGKRLAALHGRLSAAARDHIMGRFRAGLIDLLVATSIIEVGVDVPNATVIVIEQADRFGLAQLHQLRGRVGRGSVPSECILVASDDDPAAPGAARLSVLAQTRDGFQIAERDLELRGPGELIGLRQAGAAPFRVAEFPRDADLLLMARRDAAAWIAQSPVLAAPGESLLRSRLLKQHGTALGLVDIA